MSISGQIVDTETANEFMMQTLEKATRAELGDITGELEKKSKRFQEILAPDKLPELSEDDMYGVLRHIFATRRKARAIIDAYGVEFFRKELPELLYGSDDPPRRFETFVEHMGGFSGDIRETDAPLELAENVRCDLASELLHFTIPDAHWLWTRWMWDARLGTGALPLVVEDEYDLTGTKPGEIYTKVGVAVAFVRATGEAAGFSKLGDNELFNIDVFLACVYSVYMYTTLRLRMTQEFNKVVPQLPELVRRFLGVWRFDL